MITDCLREIVTPDCQATPRPDGVVVLEEQQASGKMEVNVSNLGNNAVVIRLDKKEKGEYKLVPPRGIEDGGSRKKRCDYLIVRQDKRRVRALFVELKSNMDNAVGGYEQLRRSRPSFEYLYALCQVENNNTRRKYETRYVLIAEKEGERFDKQSVKHKIDKPKVKRHEEINVSCRLCPGGQSIRYEQLWG